MTQGIPVFRFQFPRGTMLLLLLLPLVGCGAESDKTSLHDHEHEVPAHEPRSLADLGKKIRARVAILEKTPDDSETVSELNDLISWSAEIAADTNITEETWMPIYELSEAIRGSIEADAADWGTPRCDQAIRLCQLTEDAWRSLPPSQRRERYLGHDHDHGHSHGDHDHGHSHHDHDHDDHDHADHDHADHDHGDHDHADHSHDHSDHGPKESSQ